MRIVTGRTMAEIDRVAIHERGIPSLSLMERAGRAVAVECHALCRDPSIPILILCGRGNNGGDGWVAARYLLGYGYRPRVVVSHPPEELSPDSRTNFERYRVLPHAEWVLWNQDSASSVFEDRPIVVDALLGTGAHGIPRAPYDDLITRTEESARFSVGVDIPSGVDSETGEAPGPAVSCRTTVTFGLPKVGHFLKRGLDLTGALVVADIGFPPDLLESASGLGELITSEWVAHALPSYPISTHKGRKGRVVIVAGSARLMGAALLAARAAVAAGSGLVTLALPRSFNPVAKVAVPEAMTFPLPETADGGISSEGLDALLVFTRETDAVAIGPGLGTHPETAHLVIHFLSACEAPVVVDADGLNALKKTHKDLLRSRCAPTILTPHPGEMARFLETDVRTVEGDRWKTARETAQEMNLTVVLKGAATVIAGPDGKIRVNRGGDPAMAQGGMGDVLTGVITAFLGQGLPAEDAAALGVFLHGRAGWYAARETGALSVSAGRVIETLGEVIGRCRPSSPIHSEPARLPEPIRKRKG